MNKGFQEAYRKFTDSCGWDPGMVSHTLQGAPCRTREYAGTISDQGRKVKGMGKGGFGGCASKRPALVCENFVQYNTSGVPAFLQYGCWKAMTDGDAYLKSLMERLMAALA